MSSNLTPRARNKLPQWVRAEAVAKKPPLRDATARTLGRHHLIPLDHPIPATTEPNPSSLPAIKAETQPSESPELEPAK
jgi:hypothetical protein